MRLPLHERERGDGIVVLEGLIEPAAHSRTVAYATALGALARTGGDVAGAFDREHGEITLPPSLEPVALTLEVERRSLPTNGLPPGPGWRWTRLVRASAAEPAREAELGEARPVAPVTPRADGVPVWGHGHLDVAWLWTYEQARRKAMRTFANALVLLESDPYYVFVQSQPQLYAFVRETDPAFFERVAAFVREGRFDSDVAAMWVEPDCNVPSGESLLRQLLFGRRFCSEVLGVEPAIAWLPDTFGFPRTLPTLLAHAGIRYFGTTKLQWNDTTRFAHPQFVWRGPDGSEVVSASIDKMEGGSDASRVRIARERGEPLIVGYGDGGGGPTAEQVREAASAGFWERPRAWFARQDARRAMLPVVDDELYLEYHRGTYTTHHDVKAANAELERKLAAAEELASWCAAVRAPQAPRDRIGAALRDAWEIVLRNQFHDVLPGTSIAEVYVDARAEFERANRLVDEAAAAARAMLPRSAPLEGSGLRAPVEDDSGYVFSNGFVTARVNRAGALVDLAAGGARSQVAQANVLAHYRDVPRKWEAWDIDAGYDKRATAARPHPPEIVDGGLEVPFRVGKSLATMRVTLGEGDPFLRVEFAIDWRERRRLLRLENWLAIETSEVVFGAPHGTVVRSAKNDTPERRARFEVPGQRFALARDGNGDGVAIFSLDGYGWSARALPRGGISIGHSLLRGTTWPDPGADLGTHRFAWAFAPVRGAGVGALELAWLRFAGRDGVRLFESDRDAVLVVACKPAEDGNGVIVRVRECDGAARRFSLRCGGRMRAAAAVDALERPEGEDPAIEAESLTGEIGAYALRSFRVTF